jgi:acetoin utilization deacetylase AcuC-like enzyme
MNPKSLSAACCSGRSRALDMVIGRKPQCIHLRPPVIHATPQRPMGFCASPTT